MLAIVAPFAHRKNSHQEVDVARSSSETPRSRAGTRRAFTWDMAHSFRDMVTWQLAFELKEKVIALIARSPEASEILAFAIN